MKWDSHRIHVPHDYASVKDLEYLEKEKQNGGCQGLKGGENRLLLHNGYRVPFCRRKEVLWMDSDVDSTTMGMYLIVLNYMFKMVKTANSFRVFYHNYPNHYIFGHWYIIAHSDGEYLKMKETLIQSVRSHEGQFFVVVFCFARQRRKMSIVCGFRGHSWNKR